MPFKSEFILLLLSYYHAYAVGDFTLVESGTCNFGNLSYLVSVEECEAAAVALGLDDTVASTISSNSAYPAGCSVSSSGSALWSNEPRDWLDVSEEYRAVGGSCSSTRPCLCHVGPRCTETTGENPNSEACGCSSVGSGSPVTTVTCFSDRPYCNPDLSGFCSAIPICAHTDGTTPNPGQCLCSQGRCDADSPYCLKDFCVSTGACAGSASFCSSTPLCAILTGMEPNAVTCACGFSDCDPDSKPYCKWDSLSSPACASVEVCQDDYGRVNNINEGIAKCACGEAVCDKKNPFCYGDHMTVGPARCEADCTEQAKYEGTCVGSTEFDPWLYLFIIVGIVVFCVLLRGVGTVITVLKQYKERKKEERSSQVADKVEVQVEATDLSSKPSPSKD